jgi:hypothetical protein
MPLRRSLLIVLRSSPATALLTVFVAMACNSSNSRGPHGSADSGSLSDAGSLGNDGLEAEAGSLGDDGPLEAEAEAGPVVLHTPWDWSGVVGTGQSLAVGQMGMPIKAKTQPFHNLKLSTGTLPWPIDPNDSTLSVIPLIEPIGRYSTAYPSSYPTNIAGETPHASMANELTSLVQGAGAADYVGVHGEFGENGQCLTYLVKNAPQAGVNGHAYAGTLFETTAINRLAQAQGKTYGVGAVIVTHGECDAGNASYESQLYQLLTDYNTDIPAITGQTQKMQMIVSQQNSINDGALSTLAEWKIGVDHPTDVVCSGPKYQYPYYSDTVHLVTDGYEQLGEKYGEVYFERVILGNQWQPLQPTGADVSGPVITVHFHVPVPPLVFDTVLPAPNQSVPAWSAGKGFEVRAGGAPATISNVAISGNDVQITCAATLPASGVVVSYAMTAGNFAAAGGLAPAQVTDANGAVLWTGTVRWGQLRDSDAFVGYTTKKAQPNYSVAFQMTVP